MVLTFFLAKFQVRLNCMGLALRLRVTATKKELITRHAAFDLENNCRKRGGERSYLPWWAARVFEGANGDFVLRSVTMEINSVEGKLRQSPRAVEACLLVLWDIYTLFLAMCPGSSWRDYTRDVERKSRTVRLTCIPQLCLQLDPSALPSLPLSRRDHRPRFPRHAFRTAVSDNGKQLLLISVT